MKTIRYCLIWAKIGTKVSAHLIPSCSDYPGYCLFRDFKIKIMISADYFEKNFIVLRLIGVLMFK